MDVCLRRRGGADEQSCRALSPPRRALASPDAKRGTQSETGSRFVEWVLTMVTTLRQQECDVLDYLTAACAAAISGDKPPSLLPDSSST